MATGATPWTEWVAEHAPPLEGADPFVRPGGEREGRAGEGGVDFKQSPRRWMRQQGWPLRLSFYHLIVP